MRKVIAILVLLVLLFHLSGYYLFYLYRVGEVKAAMRAHLRHHSDERVVHFSFAVNDAKSLSQLAWEDDHEFMLHGRMYDVIEKRVEGGRLVLRCISDEDETALIKQFQKDHPESGPSKSKSVALLKMAVSLYVPVSAFSVPAITMDQKFSFPFYYHLLPSVAGNIVTPPPKFGCMF